MRAEFSEQTKWQRFQAAGGRCECAGCPTCRGTLGFALGAGRCFRSFNWGQTASAGLDGYQLDHRGPAWDDSLANCRLLCFGCHKETPSYGRGLAGIFEAMEADKGRLASKALRDALASLYAPQPTYLSQAAGLLDPLGSYGSALQSLLGDSPKTPTLADLIGPPPRSVLGRRDPAMILYHVTYAESADGIMSDGFVDAVNRDKEGVWFSVPASARFVTADRGEADTVIAVEMPDEVAAAFENKEWELPDDPFLKAALPQAYAVSGFKEYCVPAAVANEYKNTFIRSEMPASQSKTGN